LLLNIDLIIIGNPGVGKSSLLTRVCGGEFYDNYQCTIGVDFVCYGSNSRK